MGKPLLRAHVQELQQRLDALPPPVQVQRVDVEDNVIEFKVIPEGDLHADRGKRLNFLIYEVDAYPNSGGVMMSEDMRDEALVEAINARMGEPESVSIADALRAACIELGVQDPALLSCLTADGFSSCSTASCRGGDIQDTGPQLSDGADTEVEAGIIFEGEDEDGVEQNFPMYVGSVADRENRPGWKKLKWQETEEQRVARRKEQQSCTEPGQKRRKGGGGEMTVEEQKAAGEQMWSSQEAFTILSNELFSLQTEAEAQPTLEADATNYDVHHWTVRLRGCTGPLGDDLRELRSRFGYDYIELHVSFKEDLHPFYPPTVSVVRPRLQGRHDVLAALACHPRLQLRGWSPFQTTKDLLLSIRRFLESVARVDLANGQNDRARFPCGAFSPLERQLAQLGSLCEIVPLDLRPDSSSNPYRDDPWAQHEALQQSSLGAMLARRKLREQSTSSGQRGQNYWAAGTGYGHDTGQRGRGAGTWDPQAMRAAQTAQDEELRQLVRAISTSFHAGNGAPGGQGEYVQVHLDLLDKSCIVPFLTRELSISYTNMGDRLPFFEEVYRLVQELLRALPENAGRLLEAVRPHLQTAKSSAKTFLSTLRTLGSSATWTDLSEDVSFAQMVVQTADEVERLCPQFRATQLPALESGGSHSSTEPAAHADMEAVYCERLRALQLDEYDMGKGHSFYTSAEAESVAPQARTVRLAKELAGLASLLPLSGSSSVFVRFSSARQQLWRALVTGPDDTPYCGGCFIFDFFFPPEYPSEPPKVKLLTTGNNTVTFNPNLYESGKVCLSLLGTWKGDKAESWDPTTSRTLQVLVSIQSLILVPEPYFNEPGYEREIGTKHGQGRSREYNMAVRENCVKWAMLDVLRNPPPGFREVVAEHFRIRGPTIKEMIRGWVAEAERCTCHGHQASLCSLLAGLTEELDKLQSSSSGEDGLSAGLVPGATMAIAAPSSGMPSSSLPQAQFLTSMGRAASCATGPAYSASQKGNPAGGMPGAASEAMGYPRR